MDFKPKVRGSFNNLKELLVENKPNENGKQPTKIIRDTIKPVLAVKPIDSKNEGSDINNSKPIRKLKVTPISSSKRNNLKVNREEQSNLKFEINSVLSPVKIMSN